MILAITHLGNIGGKGAVGIGPEKMAVAPEHAWLEAAAQGPYISQSLGSGNFRVETHFREKEEGGC